MATLRYARVNLIKTTVKDAISAISSSGFLFLPKVPENVDDKALHRAKVFWQDPHLTDLLVFPSGVRAIC